MPTAWETTAIRHLDRQAKVGARLWGLVIASCLLASAPALTATVSMPTGIKAAPGGDVVVPISIDPSVGVDALELQLQYDPAVLQPTAAYLTPTTASYALSANLGTPGTVQLELSGGAPLAGAGSEEVAWLLFDVVGAGGSLSDLVWSSALLNGGAIAATLDDGRVNVVASASVFSVPDDALIAQGGSLFVPVSTTDATGAESMDIVVRHNTDVVVPVGVQKTALTAGMSLNFFLGIPGETRISLFQVGQLAGGGEVVRIEYDAVGSAGDQSPLDISKGVINEGAIPTTIDDGLIEICDPIDVDMDGVDGCAGDCDNDDADVFPGAAEICDGKDNQCSGDPGFGEIDEGFDADGDGSADCFDGCPFDPDKIEPGACGCGSPDLDGDADTVADCIDNCPTQANQPQQDSDMDGNGDACDCAPLDASDSPPVAVDDSVLADRTGPVLTLTWDSGGLNEHPYRLYRGSRDAGVAFGYNHACVGGEIEATTVDDATLPSSTQTLYYLLSRQNDCGESGLGEASSGAGRPNAAPCAP